MIQLSRAAGLTGQDYPVIIVVRGMSDSERLGRLNYF
jgi:hypothetical protein